MLLFYKNKKSPAQMPVTANAAAQHLHMKISDTNFCNSDCEQASVQLQFS